MALRTVPIPNMGRKIKEYDLKTGETFKVGALVILDTNEIAVAGADAVAAIMGFAVSDAAGIADTTYGGGGTRDFDTTKVLVAIGGSGRTFLLQGDNAPVKTDIGVDYGLTIDSDGILYVDGTDTTNVAVNVIDIDTVRNLYEVTFLTSVLSPATGA